MKTHELMQKIISLAKRRGFVYPGSEIYGGLAGSYDFGPLGVMLKKNIKDSWWKYFVENRIDMYGLDSSIIMSPLVWQASGHADGFVDPLVEDLKTNKRYRADHILEDLNFDIHGKTIEEMSLLIQEFGIKSPEGNPLGEVRQFNMMLQTELGAVQDSSSKTYLRPETAQGIFVNFKNIMDTFSPKVPFGVGQIGKAFRNEITPKDFIFRTREFEQMEIEFFVRESEWEKHFEYWKDEMLEWMGQVGLDMTKIHELEVSQEDRAHYSKRTIDFEFEYPFGKKELYGLAYRGDYDLSRHANASQERLEVLDQETNTWFMPHVIEPTFGVERTVLALLTSAYREEEIDGEVRSYLAFKPSIAPIKIAVSPLLRNKQELVEKAQEVFATLKARFGNVAWDDNGNIGKRYRRQDEIGTPFCVVVDFDSLEKNDVTVRDRNTTHQERITIDQLLEYFSEKFKS